MVRSSGHHRKRSRSRSLTPDHKRSKSSRDYDKDRIRRRSRSRERLRRSRSRDRKKDKKVPESKVRSKPLKFKRHSRSRSRSKSRSKSKERSTKKDEKKDVKADDEPFDPTNLDKESDGEEWVVTDVIEEAAVEDNGDFEEEYDYEADEDDQYSHHSSTTHHNSNHSSPERNDHNSENALAEPENSTELKNNVQENSLCNNDSIIVEKGENASNTDLPNEESLEKGDTETVKRKLTDEGIKDLKNAISDLKNSTSVHKQNMKTISLKNEAAHLNMRSHLTNYETYSSRNHSREALTLSKDHMRQWIIYDKEFFELRKKHEIARHRAEMEVLKEQIKYWKYKH